MKETQGDTRETPGTYQGDIMEGRLGRNQKFDMSGGVCLSEKMLSSYNPPFDTFWPFVPPLDP
jgi:hypothetical protein